MMGYDWKPYCKDDTDLVDSWLDDDAITQTGLEEGWTSFYEYWMAESCRGEGKDRCFLIMQEGIALAVMYLAIANCEMTISEFVVAPHMRNQGHGTAVLRALLENRTQLLQTRITVAKAVVFPENHASIKVFNKAGFVLAYRQQDDSGSSLHYEYVLAEDRCVKG